MTYHYTMCGLDYIYLQDGFTEHETEYGRGVSIERADSLDKVIAWHVVTSLTRLRGQEVRFFRAMIKCSQAELALELGVKRLTVARWENEPNTPIPGPSDRVIRLIVIKKVFGPEYLRVVADMLTEISGSAPAPLFMKYKYREKIEEPTLFNDTDQQAEGWMPAAA
jgi:putative transcriptional regulator